MNIHFLVDEFCHHKKYLRGVSESSLRRYKSTLQYYIKNKEIISIQDVTKKSLREFFLYGSIQRKWKPGTYRTHHMVLRTFLKWCVEEKYTENNYMEEIELPSQPKNLPKALSKEEARRIMHTVESYPFRTDFLKTRNHAIFALFLYTGIRKSELLNIMLHHVDLQKRQLKIFQGKGNKDRMIPLNHVVIPILKKYIEVRKERNTVIPELFVSKQNNLRFTKSGLKLLILKIREASGVQFTAHILRHTFATIMLENSSDVYTISKILGHSNIKTTAIYLTLQDTYLRGKIENYHF